MLMKHEGNSMNVLRGLPGTTGLIKNYVLTVPFRMGVQSKNIRKNIRMKICLSSHESL